MKNNTPADSASNNTPPIFESGNNVGQKSINIADYLPYYLGCRVQVKLQGDDRYNIGNLMEICHNSFATVYFQEPIIVEPNHKADNRRIEKTNNFAVFFDKDEIKPILHSIAAMTDEHKKGLQEISDRWDNIDFLDIDTSQTDANTAVLNAGAEMVVYMTQRRFDVFNLIDEHYAIDAATLK